MLRNNSSSAPLDGIRPWWTKKLWLITGAVLLAGTAVAIILFSIKWPFTREAMIKRLEKASSTKVEFGSFHSTYFPPGCVAETVVFRNSAPNGRSSSEPLMTVKRLAIQSSYHGLLSSPKVITSIVADGVQIHVPGQGQKFMLRGETSGQQSSKSEMPVIEEVRIKDAVIEIPSRDANAKPFSLPVHEAIFQHVSEHHTVPFTLALHLPLPPGELSARGWIGPWRDQKGKVRSTPVSGSCILRQANLGVFESLAGTLSAQLSFSGTLERLNITGETDSPDFTVKESGHRIPLSTHFNGSVNLLNGDVGLPTLNARLGHTRLVADANITGYPKTVQLNVRQGEGEIQDLILLFSDAPRSPITGPIMFRTWISLPHEAKPFEQRVRLSGDFNINPAQFTAAHTQQAVDQLSARARGNKEQGKDGGDPDKVVSDLKGRVVLQNGIANFSTVSFSVPGATANMHGTYNLTDKRVNLNGKMKMRATVSQATSGVKSFFLKVLDPFFKKKQAGAEVPVTMTGSYGHTHFSAGLK